MITSIGMLSVIGWVFGCRALGLLGVGHWVLVRCLALGGNGGLCMYDVKTSYHIDIMIYFIIGDSLYSSAGIRSQRTVTREGPPAPWVSPRFHLRTQLHQVTTRRIESKNSVDTAA